jgi:hypothetical protein
VTVCGAPFTPRGSAESFNVETTAWRFASSLSKDALGTIEFCYAEQGIPERVVGRVDVRPFRSSAANAPELRILFTRAEVDGHKKVIVLMGYAGHPGAFVVDIPGLTTHPLGIAGSPHASPSGEITLLGFADGSISYKGEDLSLEGMRGRLFFRYVGKE